MASEYDALLEEPPPPQEQASPYDALLQEQPPQPIIARSGAQMDSLAAREVAQDPTVQAAVESGIKAAPVAFEAANKAAMTAATGGTNLISEALTPQPVKEFMRTPLVSPEAVDVARRAAQYPLQSILFGGPPQEQGALGIVGRFASEQIAGQTTPENLAIIAGTAGVGAAEGILAKKAPGLSEILFGGHTDPLVPLTESVVKPPQIPSELLGPTTIAADVTKAMSAPEWERRFQMVEPAPEAPTQISPAQPIEQTLAGIREPLPFNPEAGPQPVPELAGQLKTETARIGEPNASKIESTTPTDGGVRTRSGVGELPAGNVETTDARLRGDQGIETSATRQGTETGPQEVAPTIEPAAETPQLEVGASPEIASVEEKVQPGQFGQKGYTALPTETTVKPEAPPMTGDGVPQPRGVSQAKTEAELGLGSVEPGAGAELGSGLEFGRDYVNKGGDPRLPIRRANTSGMVGKNDVGVVHAELERLRGERSAAAKALEANPNEPALQKQFTDADNAQRAWRKELQPVLTKAGDALREAHATSLPDADPSTYQGLADIMDEHFKGQREVTPEMRTQMAKAAKGVKDVREIANGEMRKIEDTLTKQVKGGKVMTPEELDADLKSELAEQFKDCILA